MLVSFRHVRATSRHHLRDILKSIFHNQKESLYIKDVVFKRAIISSQNQLLILLRVETESAIWLIKQYGITDIFTISLKCVEMQRYLDGTYTHYKHLSSFVEGYRVHDNDCQCTVVLLTAM